MKADTGRRGVPAGQVDAEREALEQIAAGLELIARGVRSLAQSRPAPQPAPEVDQTPAWIQPEAAARVAGLSMATERDIRRSVRRIYTWARGKRWASRPNKRTLLIDEAGFRRWLHNRTDR